jgi:UDP-glucose 4-epimerase
MVKASSLMGKRVLVTGASGFIGTRLCQRLLSDELEIHGMSRAMPAPDINGVRWWHGDMADQATVQTLLKAIKPDVIFHLAGAAVGYRDLGFVTPLFQGHVMGTVHLLTAAAEVGCQRIILSGSLEEPEATDAAPSSPYAVAKWAASAYARMFHAVYDLPVVILRVFMVYGPGKQNLRKLVPYVIHSLLKGEAPKLASGHRQIDWVYLDDVAEAFIAAASAADVEGQTIDVGSGKLVSIKRLVDHLVHAINPSSAPMFGALTERRLEQVRVAHTKQADLMLGWRATTSLERGLRQTVAWYREQARQGLL